jgi:predicted DCC family thiol-disulfide oxidoreductase YuxK
MFSRFENSLATEMVSPVGSASRKRWVLFDGECPWCNSMARKLEGTLHRRGFALAPLQTPWVRAHFGLNPKEPLTEMKVLTDDGSPLSGGDAVAYLAGKIWWAWPLYLAAKLPLGMPILRRAYRWIAARRTCTNGACAQPQPMTRAAGWPGWLPLVILPSVVVATRNQLPPWALMWALAVSIYAGCKWLTWWPFRNTPSTRARHLGYLFAWPGMDAETFLDTTAHPASPSAREWGWAALKTLLGATVLWAGVRRVSPSLPLLCGWTGLLGLVFLLHFGIFHLLALLWRTAGVAARPLMRTPALATSLGEFWGGRWNTGFHQLAASLVFKPLRSRLGTMVAMFAVFLVSGLIHDLVISFPAGAGYGLPTGYFILQAAGLSFERSNRGKVWGLGRGTLGWLFTLIVTAGPAFWLFHPWFVMRVVIPFLKVMRAV